MRPHFFCAVSVTCLDTFSRCRFAGDTAGVAVYEPSFLSKALGAWGGLRGGSWVVIHGVISPLTWDMTLVALLITPLRTTHEPPSRVCKEPPSRVCKDKKFGHVFWLTHASPSILYCRKLTPNPSTPQS